MKPFLYVFVLFPLPRPPPPSSVFPVWVRISPRTFQRRGAFSITIMSRNFRGAWFSPLLIPFTLSFTSLQTPQRRNDAFVAITPDLDLTQPPHSHRHLRPSGGSSAGIFQGLLCFACLHPEPQKANVLQESSLLPQFVSLLFVFSSVRLSLSPPPHTNTHTHVHSTFLRMKKPRLRQSLKVCRSCQQACSRVCEAFFGW